MAGVVLETLSNRKLIAFIIVLGMVQIGFFLMGGLIAPAPSNVQPLLSTLCLNTEHDPSKWLYTRPDDGSCKPLNLDKMYRVSNEDDDTTIMNPDNMNYTGDDIVFVIQFPNPKEGQELVMSTLHQSIVAVFSLHVQFDSSYSAGIDDVLTMDVRLGHKVSVDSHSNWTEIARSTESRPHRCAVTKNESGYELDCDMLPLFELGSVRSGQYLINIRLPSKTADHQPVNQHMGKLTEISVFAIHQNGGFTIVWLVLKTLVFPVIGGTLIWYIMRVMSLSRKPNVLEQTLITLGVALSVLNVPVDWFTLVLPMPFMVLYSDIRQGFFYSVLLCFWIIFAGEHMMDQLERNHVVYYWKHLSAVGFGCICLFLFEMCERGVQLTNPFYSIWATPTGSKLGLTFIVLAGIAASCYFLFLLSMVVRVFRNILAKKTSLPSMSKPRRNFYMGLIYRFSFLMVFTLVCAAMTVILFIIGNVSESQWKWGHDSHVQYSSAVQTGVYGMWNIYVFCLLIFYAPSTKYMVVAADPDEAAAEETMEFSTIPSEASVLASFVQKSTVD